MSRIKEKNTIEDGVGWGQLEYNFAGHEQCLTSNFLEAKVNSKI